MFSDKSIQNSVLVLKKKNDFIFLFVKNYLTYLLKLSYADFDFESRPFLRII